MKTKTLALALLIALLAACGGTPTAAPVSLEGTAWEMQALRGRPPLADTTITLEFGGDELGGVAGCNHYGGSYETQGDRLLVGPVVMTEMYCLEPAGVMAQEQDFITALDDVSRYRATASRLELLDDAGEVVLSFTPAPPAPKVALEGPEWVLTTFLEGDAAASVLNGTEITLLLEEESASGAAGCNTYFGPYTLQGNTLEIGPVATTKVYCQEPAGVMDQERRYLDLLQGITALELDGDRLTLHAPEGGRLIFRAR